MAKKTTTPASAKDFVVVLEGGAKSSPMTREEADKAVAEYKDGNVKATVEKVGTSKAAATLAKMLADRHNKVVRGEGVSKSEMREAAKSAKGFKPKKVEAAVKAEKGKPAKATKVASAPAPKAPSAARNGKTAEMAAAIVTACKRKEGASARELQDLTGLGSVIHKYPPVLAARHGLKLASPKEQRGNRTVTVFYMA
jgi:hypothetical protein